MSTRGSDGSRRRDRRTIERLLRERTTKGTSLAVLSARSGIPSGTLSYWSWRLRQERERASSAFVELVATPTIEAETLRAPGATLEIELCCGRVIRVEAGFDAEYLRRVIAALES